MENLQSRQVLARHGKSFYWASFFLGPKLANRAARLYEFCRFVDDLADGDLPHRQLSLEEIFAGLKPEPQMTGSRTLAELDDFLQLSEESHIPLIAAQELLHGMLQDQTPAAFTSERELLRYCHAVAGTVGLMMCRVLNCKHDRADSFAIDLGIAMQLTNISRDVLEDAKMGRRYLPSDWLPDNLSVDDIAAANPSTHEPVAIAISRLLTLSEDYYRSALLGIRLLPFRSRLAIAIALRVYRQIGWVLQRNNLAWWRGRVMVSKPEKVLLSIRGLGELIPLKVPSHKRDLHKDLGGLAGVK